MSKKIGQCIGELRINHTDKEIAGALSEYFQIVKNVSYDYTDNATVKDIRADHPELGFMDDEEIEGILGQARAIRQKCGDDGEGRLTGTDMDELFKQNPDWLDNEVDDQRFWIRDAAGSTSIEALAGMIWLCTSSVEITVDKIRQTILSYLEAKQTMLSYLEAEQREQARQKRREELLQKILEETQRRNQIGEEAIRMIAEDRHKEATRLLSRLDDSVLKNLYRGYQALMMDAGCTEEDI